MEFTVSSGVAFIVALTSGAAFVICCREMIVVLAARTSSNLEKNLRRHRNVLLDDGRDFVVADADFKAFLTARSMRAGQVGESGEGDVVGYFMTLSLLSLVAAAGFVAGLSHFA